MNPQYLLVPAILIVLGWFAAGILINLRRGDAMLKWMQGGLPRIGERTTLRWLGSSVAELGISKAKAPFRRLDTLLVLAPRDVPWIWLLAHFNGRRDTLILRAHLSAAPRADFDLVDPSSWPGKMALKQAAQRGWEIQPYQEMQLAAPRGFHKLAQLNLASLNLPAGKIAAHYWRLSLRREAPHLELHLPFPDRQSIQASQFFGAFQDLGRAVNQQM